MKIHLSKDEEYPVYNFTTHPDLGVAVEVDDETLARWERIDREYGQMQSEMAEAYGNTPPTKRTP